MRKKKIGNFVFLDNENFVNIVYPISQHKFLADKVVIIKNLKDLSKSKNNIYVRATRVKFVYYDSFKNISGLEVEISQGFRHQIRKHLSSLNFPIVGDKIYSKDKKNNLELISVGLELEI